MLMIYVVLAMLKKIEFYKIVIVHVRLDILKITLYSQVYASYALVDVLHAQTHQAANLVFQDTSLIL